MAVALQDLLAPQVMLDVISRIRHPTSRMARWFGFLPDRIDEATGTLRGPAYTDVPTRSGAYNIDDNVRTIAGFRAPGTGPAMMSPNPQGQVNYTCARVHEKIRLLGENLGQLAKVLGPNSNIDSGGQDYITRQQKKMMQRVQNAVEILAWGVVRGSILLVNSGDDWTPTFTTPAAGTPYVTINFQRPAGNTLKLDMLGAGDILGTSWANAAAPILTDLTQIDTAFSNLTGDSLTDIWLNPAMWIHVISNTQVINAAGSSNTPFASFKRVNERGVDGEELSNYTAILLGYPHVTWHITSTFLDVNGTLTAAIPDNYAFFSCTPGKDTVDFLVCPEMVSEQAGQPMIQRYGFHAWSEWNTQPSVIELISLLNGIPRVSRPKTQAYGTIVY